MACGGCASRRKFIAQVVSGQLTPKQGVKAIVQSAKTDVKKIANYPLKTGLRFK